MGDVKWIKIVTDIFDDEKILLIESLPSADSLIVLWFKLLCLAGKNNNSGVFMMNDKIPYTDEMLATIFRRDINTVRLALNTFEQFGMVEIVNNIITIPNWSKHQNLGQLEARKGYMRTYMQDYRDEQKRIASGENSCKPNSKPNSKPNVSSLEEELYKEDSKEIDKDLLPENSDDVKPKKNRFDIFWNAYPRKIGKGAAEKSFAKIKVSAELLDKMLLSIERAKQSKQWKKEEGVFIPYPAKWLNQKQWDDEIETTEQSVTPNVELSYKEDNPILLDNTEDYFERLRNEH